MKIKKCPICNKEFEDHTLPGNKIYCSKSCIAKHRSIVRFENRIYKKKVCKECHKEFTDKSANGKVVCCSDECKRKRKNRQQKKYNKLYREKNRELK